MSGPSPRHIAHAIADLATKRVRASWRYLDSWSALEAGGVPPEQIRDALDLELVQTEALAETRQWSEDGARGVLVLHGAQDSGKTCAAAWWARDRHERGRATTWINAGSWGRLTFDEIRPLLRRAEQADALVIDDAGCGESQGEHFRRTIEALLLERSGPTLISGNLNELEMVAWLGPRIISRLAVSGGRKHIARSLEMRQRDLSVVCPKTGHGEAWERAAELVAMIGCERTTAAVMRVEYDDRGGSWSEPTGEYTERLDVGRELGAVVARLTKQLLQLERAGASRERQREVKTARRGLLREAAKLACLDPEVVKARAAELVGTASDISGGDLIAKLAADIVAKMSDLEKAARLGRRAENEHRAKACYDALEEMATRNRELPRPPLRARHEAPQWTKGTNGIEAMKGQGYFVRPRTDGWDIYRKREGGPDMLVIPKCASVLEAWQACRLLWGSGW